MAVEPSRLRFTVEEYEALAEVEAFADRRLELIEGDVIEMSPIGPEHGSCVMRLIALFTSRLADRAVVNVQNPVRLRPSSEPQPDLTLLVPPLSRYRHRHPEAADVLLLVEVADTSGRFDKTVKAPLYARQGVVETWVVDLQAGVVELHRQPSPEGYRVVERRGPGEAVSALAFPDVPVGLEEILG